MIKILKYKDCENSEIFGRISPASQVEGAVSEIIAEVASKGDSALYAFEEKFDKVKLDKLTVTEEEIEEAVGSVSKEFLKVIGKSAENIENFHKRQIREGFVINEKRGVVIGQKVIPLDRVGLYVPGGTAAYPSTVLMDAIPAKLAGCREIVITTPPRPDGTVNPAILAAAKTVGINKIFKIGGAQAVAALAFGTETVPKVDKIVGPGNAYVAEAKKQVFGRVSIDMIAGPSEILIISDGLSNPSYIAADLLSQAEHDRMASAVLVTDSEDLAERVSRELEKQIPKLCRAEIARESIDKNGMIVIVPNIETAIDVSNELAPEHLELCLEDPFEFLGQVRHAGSVFMGRFCPEALGDYFAGPNHTLPTSGSAKFSSPLSVDDFVKKMQFTYYTEEALEAVADDVALFAREEGLTAHAASVIVRKEGK